MSLLSKANLWGEHIPYLNALREKGERAFSKCGLPDSKTEAWKYSWFRGDNLNSLVVDDEPLECDGACHVSHLPFETIDIKYCNGKVHISKPCEGVIIKTLAEAVFDNDVKPYLNKSFELADFPFAALNTAYLEQGLFIVIERDISLEKPIYIHYHNHADKNRMCNIRNIIVAEGRSKAVILEHFDAETEAYYFQNVVNEVFVGRAATLYHYVLQNEAKRAYHIALNSVQVRAGGKYEAFSAHGNCVLSRHESFIRLQDENASAIVNGVYRLKSRNQVCDITTNINHVAPHTYSSQLVKGVAQAGGRGVFQGKIHIAKDAQNCEGHQLHRALMVDESAEIDCKPELEIFADNVKCSHGASSGDLDKEQLFYMQLRGICENDARDILIEAYLNEVFEKNHDLDISEFIKSQF